MLQLSFSAKRAMSEVERRRHLGNIVLADHSDPTDDDDTLSRSFAEIEEILPAGRQLAASNRFPYTALQA